MSSEHLILAAIFAIMFIAPLIWLFVFDGSRPGAAVGTLDPACDDCAAAPPIEGR